MTLIEKIKVDLDAARRVQDHTKLVLLSTLLAEIEKVGKDKGNRDTTEPEALKVVKTFIENAQFLMTHKKAHGNTVNIEEAEIALYSDLYDAFKPTLMSEDEILNACQQLVNETSIGLNPKNVGTFMKHLKENYDGKYDGKVAIALVKAMCAL